MSKVMNAAALITAAKHIALNRRTFYANYFPANLGLYHANGCLSFDCWNLIKALIWTKGAIKDNYTVGNYAQPDFSCGLGDWDGRTILNNCSSVSGNFGSITPGAFLLTPDDGHAGLYVGDFVVNGGTYNVIECTGAWNGGVLCSYVDPDGTRRNCRGGYANYRWGWHGLLPWIDYAAAPAPTPSKKKTVEELAKEVIDGKWGNNPEREAALKAAGYDYRAVQNRVNELCKAQPAKPTKTIEQLAQEVMDGKWGNYPERKQKLEAAGYNYGTVQARVDQLCAGQNLYQQLANEIIEGKWGNNPDRQRAISAKYGEATYWKAQELVDQMLS